MRDHNTLSWFATARLGGIALLTLGKTGPFALAPRWHGWGGAGKGANPLESLPLRQHQHRTKAAPCPRPTGMSPMK